MLAIDARGLRKRFGRTEVLAGARPRGAHRHRVRPARAERRGQDDHHQHPHDARAARSGTALVAGHDVVARPEEVKRRISLTGQSAAVDVVLTGTENLVMMGRLSGLGRGGHARAPPSSSIGSTSRMPRADASAPTRAACADGSTSRSASSSRRRCCSSTSRPPASTPAAGRSCGASSARSPTPARRSSSRPSTSRRPTGSPTASPCSTAAGSPPRAPPGELKARIGGDVVELRDADGVLLARAADRRQRARLRAALDELDRTPGCRRRRRRRVHPPPQPRRRVPRHHRPRRGIRVARTPGSDSDDHDHDRPLVRPRIGAFTAESDLHHAQLPALRARRRVAAHGHRAARDAHAAVHLHLRQRDRPVGRLCRLRRARHHPAVRRIRRRRRRRSRSRTT